MKNGSLTSFISTFNLELSFTILVFSYVFGYILRLWSPDKLDFISAKKVLRDFEQPNSPYSWPYTGIKNDKYPYFNFRGYLKLRNHLDLVEFVKWGPDDSKDTYSTVLKQNIVFDQDSIKDTIKRSKTIINSMKMEIRVKNPDLNQFIEMKESHIRLMSGIWTAFRLSMYTIGPIFLLLFALCIAPPWRNFTLIPHTSTSDGFYPFFFVLNVVILLIMGFSIRRIEKLFHYRRVSEIFHIIKAYSLVKNNVK